MTLALIAGPANAGKVELLLDRYLEARDREPVLIVPTGSDVERVERQLNYVRLCDSKDAACAYCGDEEFRNRMRARTNLAALHQGVS